MIASRKMLCACYAAIALAALVATWSQNVEYLPTGSLASFLPRFFDDTRANPASQSITVDILLFLLAAAIFMVVEARRLEIKFVWAYILGGMLIAISVTFPLFLIARELRLSGTGAAAGIPLLDRVLLIVLALGTAVSVLWVDLA